MRRIIELALVFFITFFIVIDANSNEGQLVKGVYLGERTYSLEEWKYPGKYSPVNAFDSDSTTCFAEGRKKSGISFYLVFTKNIKIDEIRILNGFGKSEKLYRENNRIKEFRISLSKNAKISEEEVFILKDENRYQTLKLKKEYVTDYVYMYSLGENAYRGTKYDDTCISEVQFYYRGNKIEINNIKELQKDYLNRLKQEYHIGLENRPYYFTPKNDRTHVIQFHKNGTIAYVYSVYNPGEDVTFRKDKKFNLSRYLPYKYWKLKGLELYMSKKRDGNWERIKFQLKARLPKRYGYNFEFILYKSEKDELGFKLRDAMNIHSEAAGW